MSAADNLPSPRDAERAAWMEQRVGILGRAGLADAYAWQPDQAFDELPRLALMAWNRANEPDGPCDGATKELIEWYVQKWDEEQRERAG